MSVDKAKELLEAGKQNAESNQKEGCCALGCKDALIAIYDALAELESEPEKVC